MQLLRKFQFVPLVALVFGGALAVEGQSVAEVEARRRAANLEVARQELVQGDEAYQAEEFGRAVAAYRRAVELLPEGRQTSRLRSAAVDRFSQAAVVHAKRIAKNGRREEARELLARVLEENPQSLEARDALGRIDDAIRSNPALTYEHTQRVDQVRRLLYEAEGLYELAKFDEAYARYREVLKLDRYNKAARRGMERCSAAMSDYARAAYDQTRAEMLKDVAAEWELDDEREQVEGGVSHVLEPVGFELEAGGPLVSVQEKLSQIIFPQVALDQVTLDEAIEVIYALSREYDQTSSVEADRGVNIVLDLGLRNTPEAREVLNKRVTLQLQNVPLGEVLRYLTEATGTFFRVDAYAVVISSRELGGQALVFRQYKVPPTFLSQGAVAEADSGDPFGDVESAGGAKVSRLTARDYFEGLGVSFPEGALASYNAATSTLQVKNTLENIDKIEELIEGALAQVERIVLIDVTFLRTTQTNLEELGADWLLGSSELGGSLLLGGGTIGNGSYTGDFNVLDAAGNPLLSGTNPVTSGLRSGNAAFGDNTIDSVITREKRGLPFRSATDLGNGSVVENVVQPEDVDETQFGAPGFLSFIGTFNGERIGMLLRGLDQKKGIDLMVKPSVATRSGQVARVESVREMLYPTEYEPPELPNNTSNTGFFTFDINTGEILDSAEPNTFFATPSHPTAFELKKLGVVLEVEPTVAADGKTVEVRVSGSVTDFDGFIDYGSAITGGSETLLADPDNGLFFDDVTGEIRGEVFQGEVTPNNILQPVFSTTRINNAASIYSGSTIVLGGLLRERVETVEDQVPILGSLPLIGRAFRSNGVQREKEALLIFLTAKTVDPGGRPLD